MTTAIHVSGLYKSFGRARGCGTEVEFARKPNPPTMMRGEESLIDAAIYGEGRHIASVTTIVEAFQLLRQREGAMAWIGLLCPTEAQLWETVE